MSYSHKKHVHKVTDRDTKKYEKLKVEILLSDEDGMETKKLKCNLLDAVGWRAYTSWFKDKIVLPKGEWFIMYLPNPWAKVAISKSYGKTIYKLRIILHVQE